LLQSIYFSRQRILICHVSDTQGQETQAGQPGKIPSIKGQQRITVLNGLRGNP
jgi:hypothetical protein